MSREKAFEKFKDAQARYISRKDTLFGAKFVIGIFKGKTDFIITKNSNRHTFNGKSINRLVASFNFNIGDNNKFTLNREKDEHVNLSFDFYDVIEKKQHVRRR
ncbi:hypothetical protein B5M10_18980 [Pluralibacter gergoviae]|nr:hypothetical protein SS31_21700 [Pluralibacter gergoviae]OUQ95155.1 hypothetical protein B5M10_18980 [Pluralibacter gergoviae]